jgi:hypothetical protein
MSATIHTCLTPEQLLAVLYGESDEHAEHARSCALCAARLREERDFDALLDELPETPAASEDRVADVREALLEKFAAQKRRRPMPRWVAAAAALLVAGGAFAALGSVDRDSEPVVVETAAQRGSVHDLGGARVVRHGNLPDEIVRVTDGAVLVEVDPLAQNERFRVVTGDAEIEVHGTVFEVRAEGDELQAVRVLHGEVEVRLEGAEPVMLHDGERWFRPVEEPAPIPAAQVPAAEQSAEVVVAAAAPSAPVVEAAPTERRERSSEESEPETARAARAGESDFVEGWRLYRAGEHSAAAEAFARATRDASDVGLAEDAAYWQASALRESGSDAAATRAWEGFVSRFPASARADEAAVHIGRARALEQRWDDARRWFERASDSADSRIREAAAEGIAELEGR